ncbi:MAG: hypothetical protein MAG795_00636 [Candidatus Woesearchaeota archaeon]|nr:hypothetical protein [Candidatus Woesearchaeota archaeon]
MDKNSLKYELELTIADSDVFDVIKPETNRFDTKRSKIKTDKEKGNTKVLIRAKDAVALRATIDSVCQLLKVYEGVKNG